MKNIIIVILIGLGGIVYLFNENSDKDIISVDKTKENLTEIVELEASYRVVNEGDKVVLYNAQSEKIKSIILFRKTENKWGSMARSNNDQYLAIYNAEKNNDNKIIGELTVYNLSGKKEWELDTKEFFGSDLVEVSPNGQVVLGDNRKTRRINLVFFNNRRHILSAKNFFNFGFSDDDKYIGTVEALEINKKIIYDVRIINSTGEVIADTQGKNWEIPAFRFGEKEVEIYNKKTAEIYVKLEVEEKTEQY